MSGRVGPLVFERRALPSRKTMSTVRGGAVFLGLLLGAVVLLAGGYPVIGSYKTMVSNAFGSGDALAEMFVSATPLVLTGLAVALAARMLLWNIGAEGQLYMGATFASACAFTFPGWPRPLLLALMVAAGLFGGAIWALGPGLLRARLSVNEIVTTLMLNFVAIIWVDYLVHGRWRDPTISFPLSKEFTTSATLPSLFGTRLHVGLFFALAAAFIVWLMLRQTRWGYEIRVIGESPSAARYAGIPTQRNIVLVMLFSGALAGLAGMGEVSGIVHHIQPDISPNYGYTGIIVATLGRFSAGGVVVAAVLFGALQVGGYALQTADVPVPLAIVQILQGAILFIAVGAEVLARFRIGYRRRPEDLAAEEAAEERPAVGGVET